MKRILKHIIIPIKYIKIFYLKIDGALNKVFDSHDFYIFAIFLFTLGSLFVGELNYATQNRMSDINSYITNLSSRFQKLDSIFSDSQIAGAIFGEQTFAQKAYKEYLNVTFLIGHKIDNPKQINEIKTHQDLNESISKDTVLSYNNLLTHLYIDRDMYVEFSTIYTKLIQRFQYATAVFALFLALNRSKKMTIKNK